MLPSKTFTNPTKFKEYKIGDLLDFYQRPCKLVSEEKYQLVTVKRRNEGIVSRGIYKGSNIKTPTQFYIKSGDFLISKRQIVHGACEIVPEEFDGAIVSNEYTIARGKEDLTLTEYFNLLSKTTFMKKLYFLCSYGIDIEKMVFNIEDWKKRFVYIPTIEEQEKVVSLFKKLTQKVALQQEKIDLLKQQKKGYMDKIFNQELRFHDENGQNYSEWKDFKLGEISNTFSGGTPSVSNRKYYNGSIPFIRSGELHSNKTELFITEEALTKSSAKMVNEGDLLYALYGATSGEVAISKITGAINQAILCIRTDENKFFIKYWLEYMKENILNIYLQGGQGNLSANILKSLKIFLPQREEQLAIANFFIAFENKIQHEEIKLSFLKHQKQAFMQQLFI